MVAVEVEVNRFNLPFLLNLGLGIAGLKSGYEIQNASMTFGSISPVTFDSGNRERPLTHLTTVQLREAAET